MPTSKTSSASLMNTGPRVSFSTLARLMGPSTPVRLTSLLRAHKYPTDGPRRSYQNAQKQVVSYAVNGNSFAPNASNLRDYERDVVLLLAQNGLPLPAGAKATRPSPKAPYWQFSGVRISFFPDVNLVRNLSAGALKVYFGKEPLPRGAGSSMAGLLAHYCRNVVGDGSTNVELCLVYEARTGKLYSPSRSSRLLASVEAACQVIVALWPSI